MSRTRVVLLCVAVLLVGSGCTDTGVLAVADMNGGAVGVTYTEAREPCSDRNPLRNLYFGDLHAHTASSADAYAFGTRATVDEAYRFARGEPLRIAPLDADGNGTVEVRLDRPLDFAAVTDHAEFLGETYLCTNPESDLFYSEICARFRADGIDMHGIAAPLAQLDPQRNEAFCGEKFERCLAAAEIAWREIRDAAQRATDFTSRCAFTAFVGYEYTASPSMNVLHRNAIYRNGAVPDLPVSYFEETTPYGLQAALESACADTGEGCDVVLIPHNGNMSEGHAFYPKYFGADTLAEQRERAALRAEMEPVIEIHQNKGSSECSAAFSDDDECAFENLPYEVCGGDAPDPDDYESVAARCVAPLDYYREALAEGMREERRLGANPFRFGVVAGTDTHNGTPGNVSEEDYVGHAGFLDADLQKRLEFAFFGPGGLTGIWSVENSRDALFEAIRRRETFGTSGPRIAVRLFGGWDYPGDLCGDPALVEVGYERGVPMGARLPARPHSAGAPAFVVTASQDETPLERLQIIKVWIDEEGRTHERVADAAVGAEVLGGVDMGTCTPGDGGASTLCAVWVDDEFDASLPAAYYARALEIPSCRWTTYECNDAQEDEKPAGCAPQEFIRERAWSSPIWFSPGDV